MGTVIIREFGELKRDHYGYHSDYLPGPLVTDAADAAIKTVTTSTSASVPSPVLGGQTHFVEIEASALVRYAVVPRHANGLAWDAARSYEVGLWARFDGSVYRCTAPTAPAESPDTHPGKWSRFVATANHKKVAAAATRVEAVYPGAIIELLEMA